MLERWPPAGCCEDVSSSLILGLKRHQDFFPAGTDNRCPIFSRLVVRYFSVW